VPFDLLDPRLDIPDLSAGLGKDSTERLGQFGVRVFDEGPDGGDDLARAHWNEHPQLSKQSAKGVEACRALPHPS